MGDLTPCFFVYASLIEGWFGYRDSRALLSGDFAPLAMFG